MSIPIAKCLVVKAASGDERAYAVLLDRLTYNRKFRAFSVWGCCHKPECQASDEALDALMDRLNSEKSLT